MSKEKKTIVLARLTDSPKGFRDFARTARVENGDQVITTPAGEVRSLFPRSESGVPRLYLGGDDDQAQETLRRIKAGHGKPGGWGVISNFSNEANE